MAQQGVAIMQSSMQLVGHAQQAFSQPHEGVMHGFMHGITQFIGQSAMVRLLSGCEMRRRQGILNVTPEDSRASWLQTSARRR